MDRVGCLKEHLSSEVVGTSLYFLHFGFNPINIFKLIKTVFVMVIANAVFFLTNNKSD